MDSSVYFGGADVALAWGAVHGRVADQKGSPTAN